MREAPKMLNDGHKAVAAEQGGAVMSGPPESAANAKADVPSHTPIEAEVTSPDEAYNSNMGYARGDALPDNNDY